MKFLIKTFLIFLISFNFLNAQELEPKLNKYEIGVIKRAMQSNDLSQRAKIFNEAISDKEASAGLFFNAANTYALVENFKQAKQCYEKAIQILPTFYLAYKNLAYIELSDKNYDNACKNLSQALSLSSKDSAKIYEALGQCHFELKRFSQALTCYENSLALDANNESLLRAKALCLRELNDTVKLRNACKDLIIKNPREPLYWRLLAGLDIDEKKLLDAISSLEAMRHLKISEPKDEELLADLYMANSMYKKAAEIYIKKSISTEKSYKVALVLAYNGFLDEALLLSKYLKNDSAEYWEVLAVVKIQKAQDASLELENAHSKNPLNSKVSIMLADALLEKNQYQKAELLYKDSEKDYPMQSLLGRAKILTLKGDFKSAASLLKDASKKFDKPEFLDYARKLEAL